MRKIYLSGDINEESFKEFCEQMDAFENERNGDRDIEIVLNSIGGNALDAIAFLGRIRTSPCEVNVTVYGLAGSAAVLVLAACDYRKMTKESWLMVHEDDHSNKNVSTTKLEQEAAIARLMEDQWSQILEDLTGTKKEVWADLHKRGDIYLNPKECVQLGIVDEII